METSSTSASTFKRALVPAAVVVLAALHLFTRVHWRCPFALAFHQPCPTCGISRAVVELVHFRFVSAFHEHPLVYVVVPYVGMLTVIELYAFVRRGVWGTFFKIKGTRAIGMAIAIALFVLWIARFFGACGGPVIPTR